MFERNAKVKLHNVLAILSRMSVDDLEKFSLIVGLPGRERKGGDELRSDLSEAFSTGMLYLDFTTSYRLRLLALEFQMMTDSAERDQIAEREYDPIEEFYGEWFPSAVLETFAVRDEKRAAEAGWGIKYDCPVWSPWVSMDDYERVEGMAIGYDDQIFLPKPGASVLPEMSHQ